MKPVVALFLLAFSLVSCRYATRPETGDAVWPVVRKNANLELYADSVTLALLPVKDTYIRLYRGAQVVVAELAVHPADSVDSVWVKVAHSQDAQGWLRRKELTTAFVPVDSISQFIHVFSNSQVVYFIVIVALFIGLYLFRTFRKKQIRLVYFNDIDSIYPLLLCLLMAVSATLYESVQLFASETWQHYFFNPTLSPFGLPAILSFFIASLWLILLVMLAAVDDIFAQLSPSEAFFYLLGLMSACIFCYFFFILTTHFYIGYLFLAIAVALCIQKAGRIAVYRYRCGNCGGKLKVKGICPQCGAINK